MQPKLRGIPGPWKQPIKQRAALKFKRSVSTEGTRKVRNENRKFEHSKESYLDTI